MEYYTEKQTTILTGDECVNTNQKIIELEMKKNTLKAWTMILHKQGKIDTSKCNRMIAMIEKLNA